MVFAACAVYAWRDEHRPRAQAALFCFLQSMCLGVFAAQDLILFFVFFDLSIVGMYFVILGWGHGSAARSALKFFLYTFLGSLVLLLGFIGVYVSADPHTFDMAELTRQAPLQGSGWVGGLVLAAVVIGLAIKTPTVPFHTWLPPAHTDAPAIGSAVLAGVLLKLGTYGFVRIAMPMLPEAWQAWAWVIIAVGIVSVLYGALVALAQSNVKRMIAYTSVNHMGYVVLALGAAGILTGGAGQRQVAVTGAVTQMVSHGLITAALFLLAGVLHERRGSYRTRRLWRPGRAGAAVRRTLRGCRIRLFGNPRLQRVHRGIPDIHRQHRRRAAHRARAPRDPDRRRIVSACASTTAHRAGTRQIGGLPGRPGLRKPSRWHHFS